MTAAARIRYPRAEAVAAAREIVDALDPHCPRLVVAGSLRRRKKTVGDIEIIYISREEDRPSKVDLFSNELVPVVDDEIAAMQNAGILDRRLNSKGTETYGKKNKLMRHVASGIPVDLFSATEDNWWNYLVCRTGGAQNNIQIAQAAKALGWKWNPYGPGFTRRYEERQMHSEQDVYAFVGLPYLQPWQRP